MSYPERTTYYDGNYDDASSNGPIIPSVDPINRAQLWKQPMIQRLASWSPMPLDSAGPLGGILVAESEPQHVDADVVKWERTFAEVPGAHYVPTTLAYSYQQIGIGMLRYVTQLVRPVTAMMHCEYYNVTDPSTIPILRAPYYQLLGGLIVNYEGTLPATANPQIAEDSKIERWLSSGNIWVRKTPYVPSLRTPVVLSSLT